MFWPFKRKRPRQPAQPVVVEDTHLLFTMSPNGDLSVTVLPRTVFSATDEDRLGAQLFALYCALKKERVSSLVIDGVRESSLSPRVQRTLIKSIKVLKGGLDVVDPRFVFSQV